MKIGWVAQAAAKASASVVLALGSALALQPAQAQASSCNYDANTDTYTFSGADIQLPGFSCTVADKTYANFADGSTLTNPLFTLAFSETAAAPIHELAIRQAAGFSQGTYHLSYVVTALQPRIEEISTAALAETAAEGALYAKLAEPMLNATATYTNTLGTIVSVPAVISPPAETVHLQASLTVASGSSPATLWIQAIRQVPGPLPLLGAGAAWGASRRLRRRVRQAGLAPTHL